MHTSRVFGRCLVPAAAALIAVSMAVTVHGRDDLHILHPVPTANPANPPAPAVQPNRIADNFALSLIAQGTDPIENPVGGITQLGLLSDGTRTEPDQNLYLTFEHDPGAVAWSRGLRSLNVPLPMPLPMPDQIGRAHV